MDFSSLEDKIGYKFKNKKLLQTALTHRSYLNEAPAGAKSNERLEFLGDAILSFLTAVRLFETFKKETEGELTDFRSAIVKTSNLAKLAKKLDLGNYILLSKGEREAGGAVNPSILADTLEALIGAIFQESGIDKVSSFLEKLLLKDLEKLASQAPFDDYKGMLQRLVQAKYHNTPRYQVISEIGPDHKKVFKIGVVFNENLTAVAAGYSKQEAEQKAAKRSLAKVFKLKL